MGKINKISIFISIFLISMIALSAVSAADDFVADDGASMDEVQTIDNAIIDDDASYASSEIINDVADSADLVSKDTSKNALGASNLSEGDSKEVPVLVVTGNEAEYGDFNTINIELNGSNGPIEEGYVMVQVEDIIQVADLSLSSDVVVFLANYGVGTYDVSAQYFASDKYEGVNATGNVTVTPASLTLNGEFSDETDLIYGNDLKLDYFASPIVNNDVLEGKIIVYNENDEEVINESISITHNETFLFGGLDVGKYYYIIETDGNANYSAAKYKSENFTIDKADATIVLEGADDEDEHGLYDLSYGDIFNIYAWYEIDGFFAPGTLILTFTDEEGNPILNDEGEPLTYEYESQMNYFGDNDDYPCYIEESASWVPGTYNVIVSCASPNLNAENLSHEINYSKKAIDIQVLGGTQVTRYSEDRILELRLYYLEYDDVMDDDVYTILEVNTTGNLTVVDSLEAVAYSQLVDFVDGVASVDLSSLDADDYTFTLTLVDDFYEIDSYGLDYFDGVFTVERMPAQVYVVANDTVYGSDANFTLLLYDANGKAIDGHVRVTITGDVYTEDLDIVNGSKNITVPGLEAGAYSIEVFFFNTDNYVYDLDVNYFNVTKATPVIELSDIEAEWGTPVIIPVEVSCNDWPIDGFAVISVNWIVDGLNQFVEVEEGRGSAALDISNYVKSGEYDISAVFLGNRNYNNVSATAKLKLSAPTEVEIEISADGNLVNIEVMDAESTPVENATVSVLVDGNEYANITLDENGSASIALEELDAGLHNVTVKFDDGKHDPAEEEIAISIPAQNTLMDVVLDKNSIVYGDGAITVNITLSSNGNPIDGIVEMLLNGELQKVSVTAGEAIVIFDDLAAGNYSIVAQFNGTGIYRGSGAGAGFNVERKATQFKYSDMNTTAINYIVDGRNGEYFYFTLQDADGNALANKNVTIGFNGHKYDRTTDENGTARVQINLAKVFRYTFAIIFAGDENYSATFEVAVIEVFAQTPKLTAPAKSYKASAKTKALTAAFKTANGNAVSGKKISFTVNGKTYTAKTNSKGVATVKVSINKKGTYKFTAKFAGDATYAAVSKSSKLTIK